MISDERLAFKLKNPDICSGDELEMAKELLALRKGISCQHQWDTLKLVECGGSYQYCKLCGNKKVAQ